MRTTTSRHLGLLAVSGLVGLASCTRSSGPDRAPPTLAATVASAMPTAAAVPGAPGSSSCKEPAPGPRVILPGSDPHPAQDWLATPTDTSAAVVAACTRLAASQAPFLARLKGDPYFQDAPVGRCLPSPRGAWALELSEVRTLPESPDGPRGTGWEAPFELVHVTPDGQLVRRGGSKTQFLHQGANGSRWRVVAAFDYDGDGVSELILTHSWQQTEEDRQDTFEMLTVTGGKVVPYAPAAGLGLTGVLDVDGDGRPDLLVDGPFRASLPCHLDEEIVHGPQQIAHALPGGQFSLTDAVAGEVVRAECGPLETVMLTLSTDPGSAGYIERDSFRRIACARVYGVSAATISTAVEASYPSHAGGAGCVPLPELLRMADQKPPFVLEPPCPKR